MGHIIGTRGPEEGARTDRYTGTPVSPAVPTRVIFVRGIVPKARVVIEVSPTRVEVSLLGEGARSLSRLRTAGEDSWGAVLDATRDTLKELIGTLGVLGARATVIYHAPTTSVGVFACPTSAGSKGVEQSVRLSLSENAGFALVPGASDLRVLWRDSAATADPAAPQTHTLACADREETLEAVVAWASSAGVIVDRLVPASALLLERAVAAATDSSANALVLYVGEHGSVLASCAQGRVRLVRPIALGIEPLAGALRQAPAADASGLVFEGESALKFVLTAGVPKRAQGGVAASGDDRALALMQPTLQRAVIEIRQTLRFGLTEQARKDLCLVVRGAGARVPRLGEVIAEQLGLTLKLAPEPPTTSGASACAQASTLGLAGERTVGLLPRASRSRALMERARRGVLVGAGVAMALILVQTVVARVQLSGARRTLAQEQSRAETIRPLIETQRRGREAGIAYTAAVARVRERFAVCPRWDAMLAVLSRRTPEGVRLSEVSMALDSTNKPIARFQGRTVLRAGVDANESIKRFMDELTSAPVFKAVRLGATQRLQSAEGVTITFDVSANLVELPLDDAELGLASAGGPGGTP